MQIIDKGGKVTVKLTQDEGRRLRDASYILAALGRNLPATTKMIIPTAAVPLSIIAKHVKTIATIFTPAKSQTRLDHEDEGGGIPQETLLGANGLLKDDDTLPPNKDA